MKAMYRKMNDGSHNSSTYHKKDGTPVRAILKKELEKQIKENDMKRSGKR
jgi:hypothetical protein